MSDTTAEAPSHIVLDFPKMEIEAAIRDGVDAIRGDQAILQGANGGSAGRAGVGPQPEVDSLVVVAVLCELEGLVPFVLPESLVRCGGYDSVDEAVNHLMPQLQKRWRKHHKGES